MPSIVEPPLPEARYTYGGDEFIFCEIAEAMSFGANFKALAICQELGRRNVDGVVEICPANASYLVRLDPDVVAPTALMAQLKEIEASVDPEHVSFSTRVIDVPAYYDDPWTREVLMRFRDHHQAPGGHRPRVRHAHQRLQDRAGVHRGPPRLALLRLDGRLRAGPALVLPDGRRPRRMLEVPKYLRPRTDTPALALSHGGAFAAIYPVQGPGGYQLFAMCPVPIFDPKEELPDFQDSFVIFRVGDILKIRPVDRAGYDAIRAEVEAKTYRYKMVDVEFEPQAFFADPDAYNAELVRRLYA